MILSVRRWWKTGRCSLLSRETGQGDRETQQKIDSTTSETVSDTVCPSPVMTHGNVIFDILEPSAFRKFGTFWVSSPKFEEHCRILKKLVPSCVVNVICAKALLGSVMYLED